MIAAATLAVDGYGTNTVVDLARAQNGRLDRVASRIVGSSSARTVIAPYTACENTLLASKARGSRFIVCYPTAHLPIFERIALQEIELGGAFSRTIPAPGGSAWKMHQAQMAAAEADGIWTYGSFHAESFLEAGIPASRLLHAPLGVDVDRFNPTGRRYRSGTSDPFTVLFVGRLSQMKGIGYLIDAYRAARRDNWKLVLVGEPIGDFFEVLDKQRLPGVSYVGHMPQAELVRQYRRADAFVSPSLVEGFGLASLEAMATGLPSLVSKNSGVVDIVEDGVSSFAVPIRDSHTIADRLTWLADHPDEARAMSARATTIAHRWSWERSMARAVNALGIGP